MTVGWVTLDVGEKALIYNLKGEARLENGPKRIFLWREKYQALRQYIANQNEYLEIVYQNGKVEHRQGPCVVFRNPLEHSQMEVKTGISLDANEVLVVYRQDDETQKVDRYIQHGPTLCIPSANEWLHQFCWHGTDPKNKTHMLRGQNVFTKLRVIPDQFYYNVDEVRTADDALMRVKLMMFYELTDIEKMLNTSHDPMADFINCLCADVVAFAAKLTYMEFIERSGELNDIENYPQLKERCKIIGYEVSKVVFRGYFAAPKLQETHDKAIAARTKLRIEYEGEQQKQVLIDLQLRSEIERISMEQKMEINELEHKQSIEKSSQEHILTMKKKDNEDNLNRMKQEKLGKLEHKKMKEEEEISFYTKLKDMGVDVSQYILSFNPKPDKIIQVVAGDTPTNLHLHRN